MADLNDLCVSCDKHIAILDEQHKGLHKPRQWCLFLHTEFNWVKITDCPGFEWRRQDKEHPNHKKFILFMVDEGYTDGGIDDIFESFDRLDEAKDKGLEIVKNSMHPDVKCHVVDRRTWKILWRVEMKNGDLQHG